MINSVQEALSYWLAKYPNYRPIDSYSSQSRYSGPKGLTHYILEATDTPKDIKFLTFKRKWAPNPYVCKINQIVLLPKEDRRNEGETMKTEMLFIMKEYFDNGYKVDHVTVMPDGRIFNFSASKIYDYVKRFDAYADHEFAGPRGAAYYPLRLAREFDSLPVVGALDQFF